MFCHSLMWLMCCMDRASGLQTQIREPENLRSRNNNSNASTEA